MNKKLYLLSFSSLLFSASYNILLPELPTYLINLGGEDYLGYIILLFTAAALISRPFSGKLSDKKGGKYAIIIGIFVSLIINILYPSCTTVLGFLMLRFLHGFSTGFAPTGYTYFAKNNFKNQGKAISIQTAFYAAGMAVGPLLSSYITDAFGINILFYTAAGLGIMAMLLLALLKETIIAPNNSVKKSRSLIDYKVWKPALSIFWVYLSFGILLIGSPLISSKIGFTNKGVFFFCFTLATIVSRIILRNKFEQSNIKALLYKATFLLFSSALCFALWHDKIGFISASLLFGFAMGIFVPALNLWALNKNSGEDGKAISTLYIFMELGIGIGAFIIGKVITKYSDSFSIIFLGYALLSLFMLKLVKNYNEASQQN